MWWCVAVRVGRYRTLRTMLHKQRNYALAKGMKLPDTSALQQQRAAAAKAKADELAEAQRKLREAAERMEAQKRAMKAAQPDSDDDDDDGDGGGGGGGLRLGGLDALTKGNTKAQDSDASSVMSAYSDGEVRVPRGLGMGASWGPDRAAVSPLSLLDVSLVHWHRPGREEGTPPSRSAGSSPCGIACGGPEPGGEAQAGGTGDGG